MGKPLLILADTHVVLWLALDEAKISKPARKAIEQARRQGQAIAVSSISLLEITLAEAKGRVDLKVSLETFLSSIEQRFAVLAMTGRVCALTRTLPDNYPRDPADRVIAATALDQGLSLITADREIHRSRAVPTIW
jgi:PIN domain nuclease of toxin-antitoxin system